MPSISIHTNLKLSRNIYKLKPNKFHLNSTFFAAFQAMSVQTIETEFLNFDNFSVFSIPSLLCINLFLSAPEISTEFSNRFSICSFFRDNSWKWWKCIEISIHGNIDKFYYNKIGMNFWISGWSNKGY